MKLNLENLTKKIIFLVLALVCLWPSISAGAALLLGLLVALTLGNPFIDRTKVLTSKFLAYSVVGLGAGMNLKTVATVGLHGFGYTVVSISASLFLGLILGRLFQTPQNTSLLISVGTAICGGSAIAAVAPVIGAKNHEVSISLATVFILNAIALFIFPQLGHHFDLSQTQFGLWSALAIHDTSSVVGATLQYGAHALEVGTTVKLARALWIVPVTAAMSFVKSRGDEIQGEPNASTPAQPKTKRPWFILGFLIMAALVTFIPALQVLGHDVEFAAKRFLVVTLFLIGANLNSETLKTVGIKPVLQGVSLWLLVGSATLFAVIAKIIV